MSGNPRLLFRSPQGLDSKRLSSLERGSSQEPIEGDQSARQSLTIKKGSNLQRLFSAFPDGWPGRGLLLLRISISVPLFYWGIGDLSAGADSITLVQDCVGMADGILLLAGLWTPLAGIVIALDEAWIAFFHQFAPQGHLLVAALGICLAMLGPGAWSVDARLFGRRVFEMKSKI